MSLERGGATRRYTDGNRALPKPCPISPCHSCSRESQAPSFTRVETVPPAPDVCEKTVADEHRTNVPNHPSRSASPLRGPGILRHCRGGLRSRGGGPRVPAAGGPPGGARLGADARPRGDGAARLGSAAGAPAALAGDLDAAGVPAQPGGRGADAAAGRARAAAHDRLAGGTGRAAAPRLRRRQGVARGGALPRPARRRGRPGSGPGAPATGRPRGARRAGGGGRPGLRAGRPPLRAAVVAAAPRRRGGGRAATPSPTTAPAPTRRSSSACCSPSSPSCSPCTC